MHSPVFILCNSPKDSPDQQMQWRNNMLQSPRYNEFILPSWLLQGSRSLGFTDMQDQQPQQGDARVSELLGAWLDTLSSLSWRLPSLQLPITYLSKVIISSSAIALGLSHQVLLTCFVSPEADHTAPTLLWSGIPVSVITPDSDSPNYCTFPLPTTSVLPTSTVGPNYHSFKSSGPALESNPPWIYN